MKNLLIVFIISAAVIFGIIFLSTKKEETKTKSYAEMTSREVAMICTTDMATEYHIHPMLSIFFDNEKMEIPANIGVTPSCMNSLHTHDATGKLHVESPVQKDFTLGDFFAVWGQPLDKDHILYAVADTPAGRVATISVTVNGVEVDTYENTLLKDGDNIVITYKGFDQGPD